MRDLALALCAARRISCAGPFWFSRRVMAWAGAESLSAMRALRHGTTNMNTLVGLGTSVAFLYSAYATIWPASTATFTSTRYC